MKEIFNYKFWLEIGDKTVYDIFLNIGFLTDSKYYKFKKKLKNYLTNQKSVQNHFIFFYKKWTLKRNIFLIFIDFLFLVSVSIKYFKAGTFILKTGVF